jgi:uncharacterized C2H2 Zn-finger protein
MRCTNCGAMLRHTVTSLDGTQFYECPLCGATFDSEYNLFTNKGASFSSRGKVRSVRFSPRIAGLRKRVWR